MVGYDVTYRYDGQEQHHPHGREAGRPPAGDRRPGRDPGRGGPADSGKRIAGLKLGIASLSQSIHPDEGPERLAAHRFLSPKRQGLPAPVPRAAPLQWRTFPHRRPRHGPASLRPATTSAPCSATRSARCRTPWRASPTSACCRSSATAFDQARFPKELIPEIAELGLLGSSLPEEYGCAGLNAVSYGLICQELERGDSGIRSFVSVQSSLCMYPIYAYGTEEQRKRWLPDMAAGKVIGCFGLTEPHGGSDPANMKTNAKRDGGDWILNGSKMWITNGNLADIAIVWAQTDDGIQGFVVEKDIAGFAAQEIKHKMSLRASVTSALFFDNVRVPEANRLPNVKGLKGPLGCLTQARYGITWGPIGAAIACLDEALNYSKERILFDRPVAATQSAQLKLADMARRITAGAVAVAAARPPEGCRQDAADAGVAGEVEQLPHGHRHRARVPRPARRRRHHHRALPRSATR